MTKVTPLEPNGSVVSVTNQATEPSGLHRSKGAQWPRRHRHPETAIPQEKVLHQKQVSYRYTQSIQLFLGPYRTQGRQHIRSNRVPPGLVECDQMSRKEPMASFRQQDQAPCEESLDLDLSTDSGKSHSSVRGEDQSYRRLYHAPDRDAGEVLPLSGPVGAVVDRDRLGGAALFEEADDPLPSKRVFDALSERGQEPALGPHRMP